MNWMALIGVALFGGLLGFGLGTGTMPLPHPALAQPDRDDNPVAFWSVGVIYVAFFGVSLLAFVGLLR